MKLNITKVLNEIANEESTLTLLVDPDAFWNIKEDINHLKETYNDEVHYLEWMNDYEADYCDWCMANKYEFKANFYKIPTFDEWLADRNKVMSKYLVAA